MPHAAPCRRAAALLLSWGACAAPAPLTLADHRPDAADTSARPIMADASGRYTPTAVTIDRMLRFHMRTNGEVVEISDHPVDAAPHGSIDCQEVLSYSNVSFDGGTYFVQGGFAENEIAAAEFVVPPEDFPIKIDLMEMLFGTSNATQQTTTEWSVLVWDGPPSTGILVAEYSSDDVILPHLVMPPGTSGVNVQVSVDPGDPEQIFITNESGTGTFTIGFRIDDHHQQTSNPCFTEPPSCCNAFPMTDTNGIASPTRNWLRAINCGAFGCPPNGGWARFSNLSLACRPSGDWMIRATWTSLNCAPDVGACCLPDGTCDEITAAECAAEGGFYINDNVACVDVLCPQPNEACCFAGAGGGCIDLQDDFCIRVGGFPQGLGTDCATVVCFASGACCLPDGTCLDGVTAAECAELGGTYRGNDSVCSGVVCPQPTGACCFANGACLTLTAAQCSQAPGAVWQGAFTNCADANSNGQADVCEPPPPSCPADTNNDNLVNFDDLNAVLNQWGQSGSNLSADVAPFPDGDGSVNFDDLNLVVSRWQLPCD